MMWLIKKGKVLNRQERLFNIRNKKERVLNIKNKKNKIKVIRIIRISW